MPLVFSLHAGAGCGSSSPCAERDCARLAALVRQMPLIALAIAGNVLTLAAIFHTSAPLALTVSAPLALACLGLCLVIAWRRLIRQPIVEAEAGRILYRVKLAAAPLAFLYIAWAMALYMHAGPGQDEALIYSVALTGMFTIFALSQLPKAALLVGGLTLPGFAWLLITGGDASAILAGVNIFVVVLALFLSVNGSSRDFDDLVAARACAAQFAEDNRRIANTDSLTGLANRRAFFAQMSREIARGEQVFMGIVDLDGFKPVNDLYGHAVGDKVLCECAMRLRRFESDSVSVARLGGDEFGVVVNARMTQTEILAFGARICAAFKAPVRIAGAEARMSCSIGFARFPQDAADAEQLYERADFALYHGKQHHRGEAVLFTSEHETKMRLKARIEQGLRRADLEEEITLEFQPLFDATDRSIVSFEALARWMSPELGAVPPSQFVPVAERNETIHALTRTVLRKALKAAKNWPETVGVSLNLSVRDLLSPIALSQIVAIIETSGVAPARIDIEVTETSLLTDFERAQAALTTLKRLGVKISLDDFGTGYSSLAYVHRLPLDKIKIDRSFVQEMQGNGVARDIIKSMIALIGSLNLHCVTEGVETSEQFDLLRKFGCNVVQGYLFSRPIPQDEVAAFIADAGCGRAWAASA